MQLSSGLTLQDENDLERTQKSLSKLVLQEDHSNCIEALDLLGLQTLKLRRKSLTLRFAKRSLADGHFRDLFPRRKLDHTMTTRNRDFYKVTHANTERFRHSQIINIPKLLNEEK